MNEFPDAPDSARRMILKGAVAGGLAGLGLGAFPFPAFADADAKDWPADAFKQKSEADALKALYGKIGRGLRQDQPRRAGDRRERRGGADRGRQHAARASPASPSWCWKIPTCWRPPTRFRTGTAASVSNRLKMAKTSKVVAVVESGGKLYSATKEVKVTVGGCGG